MITWRVRAHNRAVMSAPVEKGQCRRR
jgi:hypothetical protein